MSNVYYWNIGFLTQNVVNILFIIFLFYASFQFFLTTGCPKIKTALGKYLELALYGFQMIPFYSKEDLLGHDDPSGPLLGHPKMYSTSWDPIFNPWSAFERQEKS